MFIIPCDGSAKNKCPVKKFLAFKYLILHEYVADYVLRGYLWAPLLITF